MGTVNFTVGKYGTGNTIFSTAIKTSDAYTSSTTASNVEDGSGDISLVQGDVMRATIDEAAWIAFGGTTATVGTGFYMRADTEYEWECKTPGTVSIIDVA